MDSGSDNIYFVQRCCLFNIGMDGGNETISSKTSGKYIKACILNMHNHEKTKLDEGSFMKVVKQTSNVKSNTT